MKKIVLILIYLLPINLYSFVNQNNYSDLINKIDELYDHPNLAWPYIEKYIAKAKKEKEYQHLFYAYKEAIYAVQSKETKLKYADSLIYISQNINHSDFKVQAYLSKGLIHYQNKELKEALKQYQKAYNQKDFRTDDYLLAKLNMNTAIILVHLFQYKDANDILQNNLKFYKKKLNNQNSKAYYLNTIFYLGKVNQKLRNYQIADEYNKMGLELSKDWNDKIFISYFEWARAIDQFYSLNYQTSIQQLKTLENIFIERDDFNTLASLYEYLGLSYHKLNQNDSTMFYLNKVDSIFNIHPNIDVDYRNCVDVLYKIQSTNRDVNNQDYYINQLLKFDKINHDRISMLPHKALQITNSNKNLNHTKNMMRYIGISLAATSLLCIGMNKRGKYRKLLASKKINSKVKLNQLKESSINPSIIHEIEMKLEKFENNHGYLKDNISLKSLAADLNTNSLYLSYVINKQKKSNFNTYINTLRINYLLNQLEKNPKYLNYSLKGLAQEIGFKTARHFTEQFYRVTSQKPLEYIKNKYNTNDKSCN